MKKNVHIFIVLLLFPLTMLSQVELSGKVVSESEPVAFANVVITDTSDAIVTGVITEEDGSFTLELPKGTYTVSISFLGFESFEQQIQLQDKLSLGVIELKSMATELEGVKIIAKIPLIERKTDRIIFNVEQSVAASGGDAVDALKQAPGIVVRDNTIAMFGKSGMRLMVDGRILQLSGDEMFNFLNAIQSKDIKSIEVITNPPAKYEVEGSGGLINIILKKGLSDSWKNTISAAYKKIELGELTVGNNFKYRKGKVNILAIANGLFGNQRYLQEQELFYTSNTWDIQTTQERDLKNISGRLLVDFNLTENSTLGFQFSGGYNRPFWDDIANTEIRNTSGQIDSIINSVGVRDSKVDNYTGNVHYYTRLDTMGRSISIDVDFFNYKTQDIRDVLATTFLGDGSVKGLNFDAINITDRDIDNFSAKVDIDHPFKFANLSYGGKITYTNSVYGIINDDMLAGRLDVDEFQYLENIQAVYVNAFKKLSEKWKLQLGLRVENTTTEGESRSLNITNNFDYFKVFPTFYLTFQPNENNTFSVNYGRRINRPYFSRLNPASFFINQSTRSVGNPFLQPSFSDNFELTHLYKGRLTSTAFFEAETDGIGTVAIADNDTFEQVISSYNYFTLYRMGLSESYNLKLTNWWDSNNSLYLVYYISEITNDLIQAPVQDNFSYYFSTDHSFVLNEAKTHRAQLSYWYSGPFTINQTENEANQALNISLRSTFFNKKLQLAVSAIDIFDTSPRISTSDVNGVVSTFISRGIFRGRGFRVSLNYSFGNDEINVRQRSGGNSTEERRAN